MINGHDIKIKTSNKTTQTGFTIVELLIVVVVIAILAAITIVAYNGVRNSSIASVLQSDLNNAAKQLELKRVSDNSYPSSDSLLPKSQSVTYRYDVDNSSNPPTYCLTAFHDSAEDIMYHVDNNGTVKEGPCEGHDEGGFDVFNWENIGATAVGILELATSYDGQVVYIAYGDNSTSETPHRYINKSTDGGQTWITLENTRGYYWNTIETSRDGQKILASYSRYEGGGISDGGVWFSQDGGQSWGSHATLTNLSGCCEVSLSKDASIMVASGGGRTYYSTDDGLTWTQMFSRAWQQISLSEDGQYGYAVSPCGSSQGISVSSNFMGGWVNRTVNPRCTTSVANSRNGQIVIIGYSGSTYGYNSYLKSEDYGSTWDTLTLPDSYSQGISKILLSESAKVAVAYRGATGRVYVSKDEGVNWEFYATSDGSTSASRYVRTIALSGNGRVMYAANMGYLYKGTFE